MYERVKALALLKGMTVQSVEEKAGLSRGSLIKWKEHSPSIDKAMRVAKILGVDVGELVRK